MFASLFEFERKGRLLILRGAVPGGPWGLLLIQPRDQKFRYRGSYLRLATVIVGRCKEIVKINLDAVPLDDRTRTI